MPFQNDDQPQDNAKSVCLGKIASAHGVKGLVKILCYGDDPALIAQAQDIKITLKNPMGKYYLAAVEGCNSREDAEKLIGTELYVPRSALPELGDGDGFYIEDLIGLKVIENNQEIGRIKDVHNFGAGDLLDIALSNGSEMLLPFNDDTVSDVDIEGGFVCSIDHAMFILE